jgi:hypothetical protein
MWTENYLKIWEFENLKIFRIPSLRMKLAIPRTRESMCNEARPNGNGRAGNLMIKRANAGYR